MKIIFRLALIAFLLQLVACGVPVSEAERLRAENDSLRAAQAQTEEELNFYFRTMSEISHNLEKIKAMDGMLSSPSTGEGANVDIAGRVEESLEQVSALMRANNKKIELLNRRLSSSLLKSRELERVVSELTAENSRQARQIDIFRRRVTEQGLVIDSQRTELIASRDSNALLLRQKDIADRRLAGATERLYTAWYVFGTNKELKAQGIIAPNGTASKTLLKGDFNKDYFVRIDTRKRVEIPLYSRRAKLLTTHPDDSYILEKHDGLYRLDITEPADFWSVSNYLVISID